MPKMLHMLNLAGFGLRAWDRDSREPGRPWSYGSTDLPIFDRNLESLASKVEASAVLAHVRGVTYRPTADRTPAPEPRDSPAAGRCVGSRRCPPR